MKKTAVIYDKWLDSLGGGEMVACNMARILLDNKYDVTIACKKEVLLDEIKSKLNIDISGVKFVEIWNDEKKLEILTKNKDLFINISFIDYQIGHAKKNIYYAHFPTPIYHGIKSFLITKILYPFIAHQIKPIEFIDPPKCTTTGNKKITYLLNKKTSIGYSYLSLTKTYNLKFFIYHPVVSKDSMKSIAYKVTGADIISQQLTFDHYHNVFRYSLTIHPTQGTIYLSFEEKNSLYEYYLIEPQLYLSPRPNFITKLLESKLYTRVRAGIFDNVKSRLGTYDKILVHSKYVSYWIQKYWGKKSTVIYPPVEMLFHKKTINYKKKKNYILSIGRFFTLGHSKKQDIMIQAFKQMCDDGLTNWELHLAGGLGNEPSSIEYFNKLKKIANDYPIHFHVNKSRQEIVDLCHKSKIYWHAAGFGQNKNKNPINFEHFGITPVESISAGCTPVLFNGGGLPEIIELLNLDSRLYLFNTIPELIKNTTKIIKNNHLLETDLKLLENIFSEKTFKNKFLEIINSLS